MKEYIPKPQVDPWHYRSRKYNHRVRWMNYWHQINDVVGTNPKNVLEIGKGIGLVSEHLKKLGIKTTTVDIDARLSPDVVASVERIPLQDALFDTVLVAEVLEHLPWEKTPSALSEIHRVAKNYIVISLPFSGSGVSLFVKFPRIRALRLFIPIPYFWKNHVRTRQHYWSVGTKDFPLHKVRRAMERARFKIVRESIYQDDFNHVFFILEKL